MGTRNKRILCPVCGSDIDRKTFLTDGTCAGCGEDLSANEEIIGFFSDSDDGNADFDDSIESYKKTRKNKVTTNRSKGLSASMTGKIVKKGTDVSKPVGSPLRGKEPETFCPTEMSDEELDKVLNKLGKASNSDPEIEKEADNEDDTGEIPVIDEEEYTFAEENEEVIELEDEPSENDYAEDAAEEEYENIEFQDDEEETQILEQMRRDLEEKNNTSASDVNEDSEDSMEFDTEEEEYEEPDSDDEDAEYSDYDDETEEDSESLSENETIPEKAPVIMSVADMIRQKCHHDSSEDDYATEKREVEKDVFDSNADGYYNDTEASEPPQADIIPKKTILKIAGTVLGLILFTVFFIYYV